MTLQQLRCLCAVVDEGMNLSRAARAVNTSQPAATKMIRAMEKELGFDLLVRAGRRIVTVTEPGQEVVARAREALSMLKNLKLAASDSHSRMSGELRIGTSHLHARYSLPDVIKRFTTRYPEVDVHLALGTQAEVAHWTSSGEVDIGVGTIADNSPANLLKLDAHSISRCVIAPLGHPILRKKKPSLQDIGSYPLISYEQRSRTGKLVELAFIAADITPKVTLKANSADIVKTYVATGMGIAVVQTMAIDKQDRAIRAINLDHLFPPSTSSIILRRDQYLRRFLYEFIAMVAPRWTPDEVDKARRRSYQRPAVRGNA